MHAPGKPLIEYWSPVGQNHEYDNDIIPSRFRVSQGRTSYAHSAYRIA
jgi:hypothetical protein